MSNSKSEVDRLMERLTQEGVKLRVENGKLRYKAPPGVMTAELLQLLKKHKNELVDNILQQENQHDIFSLRDFEEKQHEVLKRGKTESEVLEYCAWFVLVVGGIGGTIIAFVLDIGLGFAVILQAVIFWSLLIVISSMSQNLIDIKNMIWRITKLTDNNIKYKKKQLSERTENQDLYGKIDDLKARLHEIEEEVKKDN